MNNQQRLETIQHCLTQAFHPIQLEVIDESQKHIGHAGAKTGLGHFKIRIATPAFQNKSELQIHRMIYTALGDMMTTDIHALSIELI